MTNPSALCGDCYTWSSTYFRSTTNHDLTARRFDVPVGSYTFAFRIWWVYGSEGPYDPFRNRGGVPNDFSDISLDLYDEAPGGGPGQLIANLPGVWTTLDPSTHYREYQLTSPYVFADSIYFVSMRAQTTRSDYQAVLLWLACAPHDAHLDYEHAQNGFWSTGGWDPYTEDNRPYSPCTRDMDLGLQVLGYPVPDGVDAIPFEPCTDQITCVPVAIDIHRLDPTPIRGYSVTLELSPNLVLCSTVDSVSEGNYLNRIGPTHFEVLHNGDGTYTIDCATLGLPCGATGVGNLFDIKVVPRSGMPLGPGWVNVTRVITRDCENGPVPSRPGAPGSLNGETCIGACCSDDGQCTVRSAPDCSAEGSTFLGTGIPCEPNYCPTSSLTDLPAAILSERWSVAPNPFSTGVHFYGPDGAGKTSSLPVSIRIMDAGGRLVRALEASRHSGSEVMAYWDGTDHSGSRVPAGVYFAHLRAGNVVSVVSLVRGR